MSNWLSFDNLTQKVTTVSFRINFSLPRGLHSSEMVDFMAELKNGKVRGVKVKLGRLQVDHPKNV